MIALKRFNDRANHWLKDLGDFTTEELLYKPSPQSWCLAELYDHLMKAALNYQIPKLQECLKQKEKKGSKNLIGFMIFNLNIIPKRRLRVEDFPVEIGKKLTPEIKTKSVLISELTNFIKGVNDMETLLNNADKKVNTYIHCLEVSMPLNGSH